MNRLMNANPEAIIDAIEEAVAEDDKPILDDIAEQIQEYTTARPDEVHGLFQWVMMLQAGAASLPDRIPSSVLTAWRDRYQPPRPELAACGMDGGPVSPHPFWLCRDCRMALPHGKGGWSDPCPVCGSSRIWHADLSKPLGVNWINPQPSRRGADAE